MELRHGNASAIIVSRVVIVLRDDPVVVDLCELAALGRRTLQRQVETLSSAIQALATDPERAGDSSSTARHRRREPLLRLE